MAIDLRERLQERPILNGNIYGRSSRSDSGDLEALDYFPH